MKELRGLSGFVQQQWQKLLEQTITHLGLALVSLLIAILVAIPAGIFIARHRKWVSPVLGFAGVMQTIPGIALIGFMIPFFGIGPVPAIVALFLYALLPMIRNTYTGIAGVEAATVEAAHAMGMTPAQVLYRIELPLSFSVILAGVRTAAVINVGVATLAAYIGAGGLGEFIFGGIALNNTSMILAGAIPSALLAIVFDQSLSLLQRKRIKRLNPAPYILAMLVVAAVSFQQLPHPLNTPLLAGFTPEFMGRRDGYLGLKEIYGLQLRSVIINDGIMYKAAADREVDIISGSSTDGRVRAYDLQLLHDDKNIFPPYYAVPIVRQNLLEERPELEDVLNMLAGKINDSIMTELNYRVDFLKQSPRQVAMDFLVQANMYQAPSTHKQGTFIIGSKLFGDGYILAEMYAMLVDAYTSLNVITKTGLGGTKICFEALTNDQIDMYPEYTGTGLMVILETPPVLSDSLVSDSEKSYQYVSEQFQERFNIKWLKPIGFNNTYALMMRKTQARHLGIQTISDLALITNKD